jgi:hypothetical protein
MRILIISRPMFPFPPEQGPALMQAFAAWRERYRPVTETFEFFAGGGGGFGIVNVPDESALNQMMLEYPFVIFNEQEFRPIIDGDKALAQWQAAFQAMAGGR